MRALHVIASIDPVLGGVSEALVQLGAATERLGYSFGLATLDAPDAPFITGSPLAITALGPSSSKYAYGKRFEPWLRANVRRYDVIAVHGLWQHLGLAVRRVCRSAGMPYVVFPHGMLDPWFNRTYPLKYVKKLIYWFAVQRGILRDAAAVLYTCERERILARHAFPFYVAQEAVVGLGTSIPAAVGRDQCRAFLDRFPELEGKRLALFIGRIHPKKGCDLLIRAFAGTLARGADWRLVIAGPDQVGWQAKLERVASELNIAGRITWTGMLSGDLKWGAIRSAEVFALPSHQENFGVSVAEALGCGVPVLISSQVNISREIELDGAGLVASDDLAGATALLARWESLAAEERKLFAERARSCFLKHFEVSHAARNLIGVLEQVTGERVRELARA